jgi:hypothetical protein
MDDTHHARVMHGVGRNARSAGTTMAAVRLQSISPSTRNCQPHCRNTASLIAAPESCASPASATG